MPIDPDFFHAQGYARLSKAVEPALINRLCAAVDGVQARVPHMSEPERARLVLEQDLPAHRRGGADGPEVKDAIFILGEPCVFDPVFKTLLRHPAIRDAARALLDSDDLVIHFMNVTIKHPRFGRSIGWHRDYPNEYICPEGSGFVRLMLCLDGMDEAMGATRFVPGTHLVADAQARREKQEAVGHLLPDDAGIALDCAAGDLVAIHPKVLHGGGINRSARPRRNVVLQIGRAGEPLVTSEREDVTGTPLA